MKTSAEKSSSTTSTNAAHVANRPFFAKAGGGNFFAPAATAVPAVQMKMAVNKPGDKFEQEADLMADKVMRMPAPAPIAGKEEKLQRQPEEKLQKKEEDKIQKAAMPEEKIQKKEDDKLQKAPSAEEKLQRKGNDDTPSVDETLQSAIQSKAAGGQPLSSDVRSSMEPHFGADFSNVRIHNDNESAVLSKQLSARAFTYRNHIFFARDQYQPGTGEGKRLIAHELTHTLQQAAGVQRSNNGDSLIQREEKKSSWWDDLTNFGEAQGWTLLREFAPALVPIAQKGPEGIFDWLKERAGSAVEGVFTALMAPVRAIAGTGVGQQLSAQFAPILATIQEAGGKIARNDCTPLREAAEKIEKAAERLITPIVEKLQPVIVKVKAFFNALWDNFGAPIWDWIQRYAAAQWAQVMFIVEKVQNAAKWIWDKTASIRALANKVWTWFKNKLGIGEGVEGQDGLLQWVQRKLEAAWNVLKAKLEPFKSQLIAVGAAVGGVALALSPAGPILAIGAAVMSAVPGLRWIYANWGKGNMVVQARVYLEKTLIPPLQGALKRMDGAIARMAGSVINALGNFAAGMARAVGAIGGSLLRFAVSAVQWLADQVAALADWARLQLGQLSQWLTGALGNLQAFLGRMLRFFAKVGGLVLDIWGLPMVLAGELWEKVPACVRTPIEDFLGQLILKQIELFQELVKDDKAWQQTKAEVGKIIRLVFKDHNLIGAVKATFFLILRVFNLPPDMLVTVALKAASAWDTISKKPLAFIKNTVRSLGHGFRLLWANIGMHLQFGLEGWLFGELKEKNIKPPKSWTEPKELFWFALEVLGLTTDNMWKLLAKRFDPIKVNKVRDWFGKIARAVEWINKAIDTSKTPEENSKGLVSQAKEFGTTILTGIADWVAGMVAKELAILATAAAASGGLSEVLDVARRVYKAMVTAQRWASKILGMANETLDNINAIAGGAVEVVGVKFKDIMHKGMPVVIGFLADQVGLGGIGKALRDTVDALREKVDEAILWLIDKIKAGIEALIRAVKAGVAAVVEWWKSKIEFSLPDGASHKIFLRGDENSQTLAIRSEEMTYVKFLETQKEGANASKKAAIDRALPIAEKIDEIKGESVKDENPEEEKRKKQEKANKIQAELVKLRQETIEIFGSDIPDSTQPQTVETYAGMGKKMEVEPLTHKIKVAGTPPTSSGHAVYDNINRRKNSAGSDASFYIRGHLLNQNLGGQGQWNNMTPLSRSGNAQHESTVESAVKRAVDSGAIVKYTVVANYTSRSDKDSLKNEITTHETNAANIPIKHSIVDAEDNVPVALTCEASIRKKGEANKYELERPLVSAKVSNDIKRSHTEYHLSGSPAPPRVNINARHFQEYLPLKKYGLTTGMAMGIVSKLQEQGKAYRRYDVFKVENKQIPESVHNELQNAPTSEVFLGELGRRANTYPTA
jgi:hypothetical protein